MRKPLFVFLLSIISPFLYSQISSKDEIKKAIIILNNARKAAGLDTVTISAKLSVGCLNHAKYMVMNQGHQLTAGMNAHKEFPELKGYTKEGESAAKNAVIHYIKPSEAIAGWIATFYHRVPLLQPNLKEVGIGFYAKDNYIVTLIECISGTKGTNSVPVVYYPNEDQAGIPLMMGPEIPHPVGEQGNYGFPVTIYFTNWQKITVVQFKLTDESGKEIPCYLSTPEKPATSFTQWSSICAIPKKALLPEATYTVSIKCKIDGKAFDKTYHFKTAKL
jgi:hypothetical protein